MIYLTQSLELPTTPQATDLEVLELRLTHRAGFYSHAQLKVAWNNPLLKADHTTPIWIYTVGKFQNTPLLKGYLLDLPKSGKDRTMWLHVIACPPNADADLKAYAKSILTQPGEYLFAPQTRPSELLRTRYGLYTFDPVTHKPAYCPLEPSGAEMPFNLTPVIIADTLRYTLKKPAHHLAAIRLHARWDQHSTGILKLGTLLAKKFPGQLISTLNAADLKARWPRPFHRLNRSGLYVVRSNLAPVTPDPRFYPTATASLTFEDKAQRYHRRWFRPTLDLAWDITHHRHEILTITLPQSPAPAAKPLTLEYHLTLPDNMHAQARFFESELGTTAIRYALDIARTHAKTQTSLMELHASVPLAIATNRRLFQWVRVQLPFAKEPVLAQIMEITLDINGTKNIALGHLRLHTYTPPAQVPNLSYTPTAMLCAADVLAEDAPVDAPQLMGDSVLGFDPASPFDIRDILTDVQIFNDAENQESTLAHHQHLPHIDPHQLIHHYPTAVQLTFAPLHNNQPLVRNLHLKV